MDDTGEDIDTAEIGEEDRIEYIKRSTKEAEEKTRAANVLCWIETQRKIKLRSAMRIASHRETRWTMKQQSGIQDSAFEPAYAEQWEDQFLKPEETENTEGND